MEFKKRKALGRGLDALLPAAPTPSPSHTAEKSALIEIPIEELHPNPFQPRTHFDDSALDELAASVKEIGILEPIVVRPRQGGGYEIIAGERRWRAAGRAGIFKVPVYVRDLADRDALEAALVENVQREDLNPLELARAYERLMRDFDHSQESLSKRVGKDRSTIANLLRLLKLPKAVIELVETSQLSEGHGRALLGLSDVNTMVRLAKAAVEKHWSVRETERQVRMLTDGSKDRPAKAIKSVNLLDLEMRLTRTLGSPVSILDRRGRGQVTIQFHTYDDLDRLLKVLQPDP